MRVSVRTSSYTKEKAKVSSKAFLFKDDIYHEIAKEHKIRSATYQEICEIARKLYGQGKITLFEKGLLTFKLELPNFNYFLTEADSNGRRDWIAEYETRVMYDEMLGNTHGSSHNKKILEVLMRLQRKE